VLSGIMTRDETEGTKRAGFAALYTLIYFLLLMFVAIYSFLIPEFGLTGDFLQSSGYHDKKIIRGILTDTPHTAMAFGVLYYVSLSLVALFAIFYRPKEKTAIETPPDDEEDKPFFHPKMALGLGIASILMSWFVIVGTILGIIGTVAGLLTIKQYKEMPDEYARKSYIIAQIGKICSIIGAILGFIFTFAIITGVAEMLYNSK